MRVNGAEREITFDPTGGWNRWKHRFVSVNLHAGAGNTIIVRSTGDDSGNIDELVLGLQAEDAEVHRGSIEDNHNGFRGTGFVNLRRDNSHVEWLHVDGRDGGTYVLTFRYALGRDEERTADLVVNGQPLAEQITFQPTGNWETWKTIKKTVTLKPGTNNIIRVETNGQDAGNLDQVFVTN